MSEAGRIKSRTRYREAARRIETAFPMVRAIKADKGLWVVFPDGHSAMIFQGHDSHWHSRAADGAYRDPVSLVKDLM